MTQSAEDLEAIVAEIDDWHRYATDLSVDRDARATATFNLGGVMLDHWPIIRAALRERRELREALKTYGLHLDGCPIYGCTCGLEALLAQPAAGEERERG
jgi:hypothetical protein